MVSPDKKTYVLPLSDEELSSALDDAEFLLAKEGAEKRLSDHQNDARACYFLGLAQLALGEFSEASVILDKALSLAPDALPPLIAAGVASLENGGPGRARTLLLSALEKAPDDPAVLYHLGRLEVSEECWDQAIAYLGRLNELGHSGADANFLMGLALRGQGKHGLARHYLRLAQAAGKDTPVVRLAIAICYLQEGDGSSGYGMIDDLLVTLPDDPEALFDLTTDCQQQGSVYAAEPFYVEMLGRYPDHLKGGINYGAMLMQIGKPLEALYYFQQVLEYHPDSAEAYFRIGLVQQVALRDKAEALKAYQTAVDKQADHAQALVHLAALLKESGQDEEARLLLRRAIAAEPDDLLAFFNLVEYLRENDEYEEAFAVLDKAMSHPEAKTEQGMLGVLQTRAGLLMRYGDMEPALRAYRDLLVRQNKNPSAHSGLLFCLNYDYHTSDAERARAYRDFDRFVVGFRPQNAHFKNIADPDKRLKIGYISGDFRGHSVGFFTEPILSAHRHDNFEIFCYSNLLAVDHVTQRMMPFADHWRWVNDLPDDAVAEMIRMDGIDILVDLSNHTAHNRLYTLARKPAPIQMTWIGMPTTTGMSAIDYRITDARMDPEGMTETLHSEKLLRLPSSGWCYRPSETVVALPVGSLPALRNKHLTFASFNAFGKINRKVVELWGRMLREIPDAVLYMATGGKDDDTKRNDLVRSSFEAWGFPVERLRLFGRKEFKEYFEFHNEIDIALDPFPYNGGTVTAHALWMGVPVLTLAGRSPIQRMGASMMTSVGLPQFIAQDEDGYIEIARKFSDNPESLAAIRKRLRIDMQLSPLMDAPKVTHELEDAYRQVWRQWCSTTARN